MPIISNRYGKQRVRVLRIVRGEGGVQTVHEVEVTVLLEGAAFQESYLTGSNAAVVPTDTMKNTVQVLAQDHLGASPEAFGLALADHFLGQYAQVEKVYIEVFVRPWERYSDGDGKPFPHTFLLGGSGRPLARVTATRDGAQVGSGIDRLLLLNSTNSAFEGYPKCAYTTLPETKDRIFSTALDAAWTFAGREVDFGAENRAVLSALLDTYAREFSPSVQNTLYLMGLAALAAAPAVTGISLKAPNKHYLPVDFKPFGRTNANEIFLPTDEPHGQIEVAIAREARS